MTTREQENKRIDKARPALADALEAADWSGVAGDVRDGRSLQGITRDLRELGEGESWAHEVVSFVADGGEPPSLAEARAEGRRLALEKLADKHGTSTADNTTAGEDLAEALEEPSKLAEWCAVTERDGVFYLYPDCESAEAAKDRALRYMDDSTFHEAPVEVVNLDTGEGHTAEVGVIAWYTVADESAEIRAVRLLQARGTSYRVALSDTGGGVVVCAVERPDDESAPYAWVTGDEDDPSAFTVGVYTREQWEEPVSSKTVTAAQMPGYVLAELDRVGKNKEVSA